MYDYFSLWSANDTNELARHAVSSLSLSTTAILRMKSLGVKLGRF